MFFTSWVANAYLCLLSVFPEEVVRGMIRTVKEVHEKHVIDEARLWHSGHLMVTISELGRYTMTIREFKENGQRENLNKEGKIWLNSVKMVQI